MRELEELGLTWGEAHSDRPKLRAGLSGGGGGDV